MRLKEAVVVAVMCTWATLVPAHTAIAELGDGVEATPTTDGATVAVGGSNRRTHSSSASDTSRSRCGARRSGCRRQGPGAPAGPPGPEGPEILDLVEDPEPAGPAPAQALAATAVAELRIPALHVGTAPPIGGITLVGVDVWFWAVGARTTMVTAAIPGLSATATARPLGLSVAIDGRLAARCDDPGTPYRSEVAARGRRPCTATIDAPGAHRATVALRWAIAWQASDGSSGTLPVTTRTATIEVQVSEGRGLTD